MNEMKHHKYYRLLAEIVTSHPFVTIASIILVTVFFFTNLLNLKIDPDPWKMIPKDDPAVVYWIEVRELFETSDAALVAVVSPDTIFNVRTLKKVDELTDRIESLTVTDAKDIKTIDDLILKTDGEVKDLLLEVKDGGLNKKDIGPISQALRILNEDPNGNSEIIEALADIKIGLDPFSDVMSLSNVENIANIDGALDTSPVMKDPPETEEECLRIKEKVLENEMLKGKIVSEDLSSTLVFATLDYVSHEHRTIAIYDGIKEIVGELGGPEQYYLSGVPMIMSRESFYMREDMGFLIPLVILVIMGSLFLVFRSIRGILIPLSVIIIATIWTMGFMAFCRVPISIISSALPVILVAMGCAYGIHIITQYYGRVSMGAERRDAIIDTMEEITSPVLMTAITSMVGYGSLVTSSLSPIREFGVFTTFGIFSEVMLSLFLIPALLILTPAPKKISIAVDRGSDGSPFVRSLDFLGRIVIRKRYWVLISIIPFLVLVIYMTSQLNIGYGFIRDFKKRSEIRISDTEINKRFPGSVSFNVIIDSGAPDGAKDPAFLKEVEGLVDFVESDSMVGGSGSVIGFVERMNYVMHDNDPAYNRLPESVEGVPTSEERGSLDTGAEEETVNGRDLIAQYFLLYENSGGEDIDKIVDFEYRKVNVLFYLKSSYSGDIASIEKKVMDYCSVNFTNGETAHATGSGDLIIAISRYIIKSQLINLITSLLTVLVMLMLVFRSVRAGFYAITPIVFTIFINFTFMRMMGIDLDVATSMIAAMGLGDWIDFSIYFISIYAMEMKKNETVEGALEATIHNTGRPIIFNGFAVSAGFLVLMLSNFKPIMNIGWLIAATMMFSSFVTLIVLPPLIAHFGLYGGKAKR